MSGWTSPSTMKVGEAWMPFRAGIFAVPLDFSVEIRDREGLGKLHAAIALEPPDDVVKRGIEVRLAAMTVEFEFLAMRADRRHDGFQAVLPPSRVEAARMQRTITPEYMCQGCD
jgi:hypothetical protein